MKLIFLAFATLLHFSSFCQTKSETQDWIKEKLQGLSYTTEDSKGGYVKHTFKVSFTDCKMSMTEVLDTYLAGVSVLVTFVTEIPVKDLAKLSFSNNEYGVTLFFRTKTSDNIKETVIELNKTTFVSEKEYRFSKIANNDNLPERLTKAFNNLVKLCGGQVTKEVF